jgi:hypothetical protein
MNPELRDQIRKRFRAAMQEANPSPEGIIMQGLAMLMDREGKLHNDMSKLQRDIHAWSLVTFPGQTVRQKLDHCKKELQEIVERPEDVEEYADVLIILLTCMAMQRISTEQLMRAVDKKFQINKSRHWEGPDEKGAWRHVEPETTEQLQKQLAEETE